MGEGVTWLRHYLRGTPIPLKYQKQTRIVVNQQFYSIIALIWTESNDTRHRLSRALGAEEGWLSGGIEKFFWKQESEGTGRKSENGWTGKRLECGSAERTNVWKMLRRKYKMCIQVCLGNTVTRQYFTQLLRNVRSLLRYSATNEFQIYNFELAQRVYLSIFLRPLDGVAPLGSAREPLTLLGV